MALPSKRNNLHGTLTLAASSSTGAGYADPSGELNIVIGTSIANGAAINSANISLPGTPMSCFLLAKLASGTATITLDTTSDGTTPTFVSANAKSVQVTHGEPVYVGPVNTAAATMTNTNGVITVSGKNNVVACRIQNQSGATLTVSELRLLSLVVFNKDLVWHDDSTAVLGTAGSELANPSGVFTVNT